MKKNCRSKRKFSDLSAATNAADSLMDRRALTQAPICPYWCKRHNCFHIGHRRWLTPEDARSLCKAAWGRGILRREIGSQK